jgi:hypothetical protein
VSILVRCAATSRNTEPTREHRHDDRAAAAGFGQKSWAQAENAFQEFETFCLGFLPEGNPDREACSLPSS